MVETRWVRLPIALVLGFLPGPRDWPGVVAAHAQATASTEDVFIFEEIRDGIYHARGTGRMAVWSNAAVIVNEADVLVVDTHVSPAAASALLRELRRVTDKPVRYVVNTHFHFDHAHGNQVYPPEVELIGHEFTREMLASGESLRGRTYRRFIGSAPERIAALREALERASDPQQRAGLERQLSFLEESYTASQAVRPTPPTTTLERRMTLHRGGREIQILYLGRGHTAGDVVVYLPRERVIFTGDLLDQNLPYMGDAYPLEWIETLERLEALAFDVILPGHGRAFRDRDRIDHFQAYLRDLWTRTAELHRAGVPAGEAARRIDMRDHADHYPAIRDIGVDPDAVARIYELLEERA